LQTCHILAVALLKNYKEILDDTIYF